MTKPRKDIAPAEGRLGILMPGMGAVASTFVAGCLLARKKAGLPIGSLTQMGTIKNAGPSPRPVPIGDLVPLASRDDLVFGGWDLYRNDLYTTAMKAGVLSRDHIEAVREELAEIHPMRPVFSRDFLKRLEPEHTGLRARPKRLAGNNAVNGE